MNKSPQQNIQVAVDNCIFSIRDGALQILLIQMKKKPFTGRWALPGGLVENHENLDESAERILKEETNVSGVYLEQLYSFGATTRDPRGRVISIAYFALIPSASVELRTVARYTDVRWWPALKLPPLAYDHSEVARYARQRLVWKLEYTNVAWSLLPPQFTLSDLQQIYEIILDRTLDKRNFRKKLLRSELLAAAHEKTLRGAHRPAQLYRFKKRTPMIVKIL